MVQVGQTRSPTNNPQYAPEAYTAGNTVVKGTTQVTAPNEEPGTTINLNNSEEGNTLYYNGSSFVSTPRLPDYKGGYTLWVGCSYDQKIYEIDLNSNTIINGYSMPTNQGPQFMNFNPAQTELWIPCSIPSNVGNNTAGTLVVFDLRSRSITHNIAMGINAMCCTLTPNGKKAYVSILGDSSSGYSGSEITVIDTATYTVIKNITNANIVAPLNTCCSLDGRYLYVGSYLTSQDTISIIDTSTDTVINTLTLTSIYGNQNGAQSFTATPDGRYILVTAYSGFLYWLNVATQTLEKGMPVIANPYQLILSPDGHYGFLQGQTSAQNDIQWMDIVNQTTSSTNIPTGYIGNAGGCFSPDGKLLYNCVFGNDGATQSQIFIVDATQIVNSSTAPVIIGHIDMPNFISGPVNCIIQDNSYIVEQANMQSVEPQYNRQYTQNLTAQTTTSTTPVSIGSLGITPLGTNPILINAIVRGSNNTLSDGIVVSLYSGSTSGALTNLLDSETYTQEGVASNEHTFDIYYQATQTQGTLTYYTIAINSVTGGTASAKLVKLAVAEYPDKP